VSAFNSPKYPAVSRVSRNDDAQIRRKGILIAVKLQAEGSVVSDMTAGEGTAPIEKRLDVSSVRNIRIGKNNIYRARVCNIVFAIHADSCKKYE
jgi:hypothetical protein